MKDFEGRTALVTGGSRGIGRAVVLALARGGADVAVNYVSREDAAREVREAARGHGVRAEAFAADVADRGAVEAMLDAVEAGLGPVDLLVTSAGVAQVGPALETGLDELREVMRVNVDGTFVPVTAVARRLAARDARGAIVCISSIAALRARPHMVAYSASKAAVVSLARSFAAALGPAVRVNCVAPGLTDTDMIASLTPEVRAAMVEESWLKRLGTPEDIAEAVAYLLSDRAGFVTGQTLVADGGRVTLP